MTLQKKTALFKVLIKICFETEWFIASVAGEKLALVVGLHVSSQVGSIGKLFPAVSTAERLLTGVRPHVSLQQPRPGESLAAHITLVTEAVCENMHGKGGSADIFLVTNMAGLGGLSIQLVVSLLVPGQVGACGKIFATLLALILFLVRILWPPV